MSGLKERLELLESRVAELEDQIQIQPQKPRTKCEIVEIDGEEYVSFRKPYARRRSLIPLGRD